MSNAKLVVNVLLVATIFSTAYHHALPTSALIPSASVAADKGKRLKPATRTARKKQLSQPAPNQEYGPSYTVTATTYQAVEAQTDDEPFVTADNSYIKPGYSSKLRWLAVSQDLLVHWGGGIKYGDQVRVRGVSAELDGLYTVHDTMNKRHRHCIDILSNPNERIDIFAKKVKIRRVKPLLAHRPAERRPVARPLLATSQQRRPARRRLVQPNKPPFYLASAIL